MAPPPARRLRLFAGTLVGTAALVLSTLVGGGGPASAAVTAKAPLLSFGCSTAGAGQARCFGEAKATRTKDGRVIPLLTKGPSGFGPADLKSAYNLAGTSGGGRTVAIVDAYDDPKAEADLAVYRSTYGLPGCTSSGSSPCFTKVNQSGAATPLPTADYGWSEETSLDLDMVSAICPDCKILLVEATSSLDADLEVAIDTAATHPGVAAVSLSWGGGENSSTLAGDAHLNHPGVAITASTGDSGYGASWPSSSPKVTAVGGTTLARGSGARGWTETAWKKGGSGCSSNEAKPAWQTDAGCAKRTVADVAAVADPTAGVSVYDTYNFCGRYLGDNFLCDLLTTFGIAPGLSGWAVLGGTSASSPIVAGVYALAGNTGNISDSSYPYAHTSALNDVVSGTNGSCTASYLCTAGSGYDGPTGLGTPNGTGAF